MTPLQPSPDARPMIDSRLVRQMIATTLAGVLVFLSAAFAGAGTLAPVVDSGSSGSGGITIADMLRGDLSPVAITEDIAITEVQAPETVAEMLRGENSPVYAAPEIAVTDVQRTETVAEMLGGDQSPIAHGLV